MMPAMENSATFLRQIVATLLVRTRPASSMVKPAAIHITRKPCIRNESELKMYAVSLTCSAACANAGALKVAASAATAAPIPIRPFMRSSIF